MRQRTAGSASFHAFLQVDFTQVIMLEKKETGGSEASSNASNSNPNDPLYLCNFRVSVDGDWLCLKEVEANNEVAVLSQVTRQRQPPDTLAITPELDRLEKLYPNYPVGNARGKKKRTPFVLIKAFN